MSENFDNKIKRLELENFTCFAKADMDFSSGINVFIGENGTGKTHILKILSSLSWHFPAEPSVFNENFPISKSNATGIMQTDCLAESFKSFPAKLLRKDSLSSNLKFVIGENFKVGFELQSSEQKTSLLSAFTSYSDLRSWWKDLSPLFIPTSEMLSFHKGFTEGYEKRENYFDVMYYRLGKALNALPLKEMPKSMAKLIRDLEKVIGGEVFQKDQSFQIAFDGNDIQESPVVASGINKLAQMIYLIKNGSLTKDTILFWDEPEVNLNPRYIKIVAQFLQTLAKNGVQIFVATHDYLLAHLLSLDASHRRETEAPPMKFFAFYKGEDGTEIESADTIAGIQNNAILDEYSAYYDLEQELYYQSREQTV